MSAVIKLSDHKPGPDLARDATDVVQQMQELAEYRRHRPEAMLAHVPNVPVDGVGRRYGDFVGLMREIRKAQGLSHLALDYNIQEILAEEGLGRRWQDGYTGKLERPDSLYGRSAVNPSFDLWLLGLGVRFRLEWDK